MDEIKLFRRRFIPDECVELKDDQIIYRKNPIIVTKWNVLKPRPDINHGYSVYYLQEGYKISKMYNIKNELVYWYCDIIDARFDEEQGGYVCDDLLVDVLVYPDGHVEVVDLDELADFVENQKLSSELVVKALRRTHKLLGQIYGGHFEELVRPITEREQV